MNAITKITNQIKTGMYADISNEDYHQGAGVSSSVLKSYIKCPAKCEAEYFAENRPEKEQSEAMAFGSAYHKFVLEPESFDDEFAVAPKVDRRTKEGKATWAAFCESSEGKQVITEQDMLTIKAMKAQLVQHPTVIKHKLFEGGQAEQSIFWRDPDTNLLCKVRPDYRKPNCIIDLKTCTDASPKGFARDALKYGYHNSAAFYLDGDKAVNNIQHDVFILVAQEKTYPFLVGVYPISAELLAHAREENSEAKQGLAHSLESGEWAGYPTQALELPNWLKK